MVWDALRRGRSPTSGVAAIGAQHKIERMAWCLAEAMWDEDRRFLAQKGVSITLMRDERRQRLMCRFNACSDDLSERRGIIGQCKDFGTGADAINAATKRMIKMLCTERFAPPEGTRHHNTNYNRDLVKHILASVEHVCVDAAPDELLAARQARGDAGSVRAMCPNLCCVVRDRPHGSRRITLRPWKADAFLRDTWMSLVWSPESIVQTIEHSVVFKQWFQQHVKEAESSQWLVPALKSLRAARHRFESTQKPAGRFILFFEAILKTSDKILKLRRHDEGADRAQAFFLSLSEEKILQLALMADAGDEAIQLTRGPFPHKPCARHIATQRLPCPPSPRPLEKRRALRVQEWTQSRPTRPSSRTKSLASCNALRASSSMAEPTQSVDTPATSSSSWRLAASS
jgi:hypothetical protein